MEKPNTVDGYIAAANENAQRIMGELREIIKTTILEAEEGISWNVPIYKYHGILGGYSMSKNHVSFGIDVLSDEGRKLLKDRGYKTGKKTIQIKFDQAVPETIIRKLLLEQAEFNRGEK